MTPKYRFSELKKRVSVFSVCILGQIRTVANTKMVIVKQILYVNILAISSQKRNVLVCEEHSQTNENKQLLEEYKSRCILKQKANLPEYSKEIKLSFHASNSIHINNKLQQTIHSTQSASDVQDKAIYILQTIDVNNQQYNIFYDSGCGDMV